MRRSRLRSWGLAAAAALGVILLLLLVLVPQLDRFRQDVDNPSSPVIPSSEVPGISMLLYGVSEAPYGPGDVLFRASPEGRYRYYVYAARSAQSHIPLGYDASSWNEISDGDVIAGTDCRNITVVSVDKQNRVRQAAYYAFVPGVQYGPGNADQYDDAVYYRPDEPSLEDERAVRLASVLFKSARDSYYNADFGAVTQGYLSRYGDYAGLYAGYYHNGVDFSTQWGRPFFSPIDGKLLYAGANDNYHTLILYNEEQNVTVMLLHGEDVSPAQTLLENGGKVKQGDLLGYGGGEGLPAGGRHLHIELHVGQTGVYQSLSTDPSYARMTCFDPLVLPEMFALPAPEEDSFGSFVPLGSDPFSAQNGTCAVQAGSWLYYIDKAQGSAIFRSRPDGRDAVRLTEHGAANLNVLDGWLYYSDLTDGGHLVKTRTDGSETVTLSLINTSSFVLAAGENVYFVDSAAFNALYSCRTDGEEGQLLLARDISHLFYTPEGFYYTQNVQSHGERIFYYNIKTGATTQMLESRASRPFVYREVMCFSRNYSDRHALTVSLGAIDETQVDTVIPAAYYEVQPGNRFLVFTNNNDANSLYIKFDERDDVLRLSSSPLCTNLTRVGNHLYFYAALNEGNRLCRIDLNTLLEEHLLDEGWVAVQAPIDPLLETLIAANRTRNEKVLAGDPATPEPTESPSPTAGAATPSPTAGAVTPSPTTGAVTPHNVTPTPEEPTPTPTPEAPTPTPTPTPEEATPTPTPEENPPADE